MRNIAVALAVVSFLSCWRFPSQLEGKSIADCDTPTIPAAYDGTDTANASAVIEIYDFQQRLIQYGEHLSFFSIDSSSSAGTFFYWNGKDLEGNTADPGKYLVKITVVSVRDTSCQCSEVIIIQ
ncbi:MAG: hypothetical protein JW699_06180 [Chitinispirillaceae bacterium]|nr:hypothetical protein [Chitinispirillaceae bacterium]